MKTQILKITVPNDAEEPFWLIHSALERSGIADTYPVRLVGINDDDYNPEDHIRIERN